MADQKSQSHDRMKWGVAGVLVCVLGYVVLGRSSSDSDERPAAQPSASVARSAAKSAKLATLAAVETATPESWPNIELEELLLHNPFVLVTEVQNNVEDESGDLVEDIDTVAIVDTAKREREEALKASLAALMRDSVQVVIQGERGATAIVGDRVIHEGEVVDGWRVVTINSKGILVEPDQQNTAPVEF